MKKYFIAFSAATLLLTSCGKDEPKDNPIVVNPTDSVVTLTGDISTNMTLDASKKYLLKGFVYVTKGATLTIPAGTVIMGDKTTKGTLIITRGSKIDAKGTSNNPIIFTSSQAAGSRREGDWGGIVLLGKAPVNPNGGVAKIEGGLTPTAGGTEDEYVYFGGNDANDNSGVITYARIEFAGIALTPDNELNSLTMGGVGAGTQLSYIQVYRAGDDAFEWFGGTVNADHLVATYTWDDDFDTDFGYSGNVQFAVAQRFKNLADISGSNGFESDNDANGSTNSPQTKSIFSNVTIIGPITSGNSTSGINGQFQNGAQIRRNSSQSIHNSIIMGFPVGLYIDGTKGTPTHKNLGDGTNGTLAFKNNIIAGCATSWKVGGLSASTSDTAIWNAFKGQASIKVLSKVEDVMLLSPFKYAPALSASSGIPSFLLGSESPALSGASFSGLPSTFNNVNYIGAFDASNDWTAGWTTYDAENNNY
jgi:hypothetical protein